MSAKQNRRGPLWAVLAVASAFAIIYVIFPTLLLRPLYFLAERGIVPGLAVNAFVAPLEWLCQQSPRYNQMLDQQRSWLDELLGE